MILVAVAAVLSLPPHEILGAHTAAEFEGRSKAAHRTWGSPQTVVFEHSPLGNPCFLGYIMREITILFLAADPLTAPHGRSPRLLLDEDLRQIRQKVHAAEHRDALRFDFRMAARADDLLQALLEVRPQVVHLKGHGESEGLLLIGNDGRPRPVGTSSLTEMFSLFRSDLKLVVMSGCFSLPQAKAIAEVVGCVLGTRSGISEIDAVAFDSAFYRAVAFGYSVKAAFDQASAALMIEAGGKRESPQLIVRAGIDPTELVLVQPDRRPPGKGNLSTAATPQSVRTAEIASGGPHARNPASLYSLIVTSDENAWNGRRYGMPLARFGEHTTEGVRARFITLDDPAIRTLTAMPALLAYESALGRPARVARITRIVVGSNDEIRFDFEPVLAIASISAERLSQLRWELDITDWEMNRTHWAIKEIDLMEVLSEAGLLQGKQVAEQPLSHAVSNPVMDFSPTVFAIPSAPRDSRLVAVMMPFSQEFTQTFRAIEEACAAVGLRAERADTIWEETTIIQDVFNLIYRSAVTIVDLTGRNPNVMYECGIAHTLGRPVLPISRSTEALPFDLAHHRILAYLPNAEGLAQMREKLERRLKSITSTVA